MFIMLRLTAVSIILIGIHIWWSLFNAIIPPEPVSVQIVSGSSVAEILTVLRDRGLIKNIFYTKLYLSLTGKAANLQAGDYIFTGQFTSVQVIKRLTSGVSGQEKSLVFIEGWTIKDMAKYVAASPELNITAVEFLAAANRQLEGDKISTGSRLNLEGYLFPDTYRVFTDITASELVDKMLANFKLKLTTDLVQTINNQGRSIDEVVILASILEKELRTSEEKALAADVFLKRLKIGIGLQADSTVNYITGKNNSRATASDLAIDSPYNTYKHRGLPPGPISNPGLDSLRAAIFPQGNDYYYFLTTPDGRAVFSKTLDEHNTAKHKYYP